MKQFKADKENNERLWGLVPFIAMTLLQLLVTVLVFLWATSAQGVG